MMAQPQPTPVNSDVPAARAPRRPWLHGALWCVGLGLLANAAVMLYTRQSASDLTFDTRAFAQGAPVERMLGARGIYMMPAQLGPNHYGLYVMDVDAETICVYRASPDTSRFRLMAVRTFKYDRQLEDVNNDAPTPREVQKLVQQQKQREQVENKKDDVKP